MLNSLLMEILRFLVKQGGCSRYLTLCEIAPELHAKPAGEEWQHMQRFIRGVEGKRKGPASLAREVSPLVGFRQRRPDTAGIRGRFQRQDDESVVDARVGS
jgi:hypothetical protein